MPVSFWPHCNTLHHEHWLLVLSEEPSLNLEETRTGGQGCDRLGAVRSVTPSSARTTRRGAVSRIIGLFFSLLVVSCATSQSSKKVTSADDGSDNKEWTADSPSGDSGSASSSDSSSESDSSPKSNNSSAKTLPPGPNCTDQKGDVQECMADGDCCKGFYCGLDPEGNTRQKVCLYGGG